MLVAAGQSFSGSKNIVLTDDIPVVERLTFHDGKYRSRPDPHPKC
jgi:hypothetical protein